MTTNDAAIFHDSREYGAPGSDAKWQDRSPSTIPPAPESPRSYQDLDGGLGREVYFRPPRYPSAELGPVGAKVLIKVADRERACPLHDVSQNGVAFEWTEAETLSVGDTIPLVTVSFDRHEAYRGSARVGSVRQVADRQVVGVSFLDTLMNIDDVLQLRDVKAWNGAGPGLALKSRPWRVPGHERVKARIAELRLLFIDAEEQLGELEASLPWHVAHGDQQSPARSALVERIKREVVDEILVATQAVHEALDRSNPVELQKLKEYSVRHLDSYLMQSWWMRRAKEKPLGYPGDFELMNGLYGNHFSGSTLFAKAMNVAYVSTPAAVAVRERKDMVKGQLSALLDRPSSGNRPIRILSIAAGPAQETYELLRERESIPHPVEIVLFDQDKRALAFSYGRLKRLVAARWPDQVKVVYLHDTIKRLLRDPTLFAPLGKFDAIFSCGLFDYLPTATAVSLTRSLYASVAERGTLYIGNMVPSSPSRWIIEFHCDWYLIYREPWEMLEFARTAAPEADVSIIEEPTGVNPFVQLTRE